MRRVLAAGYAYGVLRSASVRKRWEGLAEDRKRAVLRAVDAGELTAREICAELGCGTEHVQAARELLGVGS